jgi:hypothetical protein
VINRRRFGLTLGALTLLPETARARPKGKIGYLHPVTASPSHITISILKQAWELLGYREGETVLARSGEGNVQRLPDLVTELLPKAPACLSWSERTLCAQRHGQRRSYRSLRLTWKLIRSRPGS